MNVRAQAKYVRQAPTKIRLVLDLVRGLPALEAETILAHTNRRAANTVGKVLKSAIANAKENHGIDADELFVAGAFADEGPTLRRFRARARGRATAIQKKTSHITIVVSDRNEEVN